MTALTKDRNTRTKAGGARRHGTRDVAANAVIFLGALIAKDAAGNLVAASDAAAVEIVGISEEHVDNTGGAAGAKKCAYVTGLEVELENDGGTIVKANLGRACFVADDQSVTDAAASSNNVYVGVVQEFTTTKVWVFVDEANAPVLPTSISGNVTNAAISPALTPLARSGLIVIDIPDAATATYSYVTSEKIEIVDAWVIKDGAGAANTVQITNGADVAITNALAAAVDKTVTRAGTIDKATRTLAAEATFKVVATRAAGTMAAQLFILAIPRA